MGVFSKVPRRIIALWFPRLPTDRLQRHDRNDDALPLVVAAKTANTLRLTAVDRNATAVGLRIGQPLANAQAILPVLKIVMANDPADLELLERIADWCDRFTPFVAIDGTRHLLLDVTGASHLCGGEQVMLDCILSALHAQGFAVRGALAGTAVTARAVAHYRSGTVVAVGEEEQAMTPLPVEALNLDATITHALRRAGLKTVGQAASRKRTELVTRLGSATIAVLDEALGRSARPITPRKPPPDYWQEQNFAEPVATEDVLRTSLSQLAFSLGRILERHGQGARRLEAAFFRADGAVRVIAIEMGAATRDPSVINRLFREKLAMLADPLDPGFGFDLIRLCANRIERLDAGLNAFGNGRSDKGDISFLVDRLATRFGSNRILVFQPHDTHVPEEAWIAVSAQQQPPATQLWRKTRKTRNAPRRPLRLFLRPEPVSFATRQNFLWRKVPRVVNHCEGPERIAMEWWCHDAPQPDRDYFRVEDGEGRRYWLYQSGAAAQWFLHGAFA